MNYKCIVLAGCIMMSSVCGVQETYHKRRMVSRFASLQSRFRFAQSEIDDCRDTLKVLLILFAITAATSVYYSIQAHSNSH